MSADFSVAVADADQYRIAFAGIPISFGAGASGYADGEFFSAKSDGDWFGQVEGSDGTVVRSKEGRSGTVLMSVTLLQTNPTNAALSSVLALDENMPAGAGIGSFVLEDLQGTTLIYCRRAWVSQPADVTLNRGAQARKWPFVGMQGVYLVGGA